MAITRGPASNVGLIGSANSLSISWTGSQPTFGSKIIVFVQYAGTITSVTDNAASQSTFTADVSNSGGSKSAFIYRADNISLPNSGNYTVTISVSGGPGTIGAFGIAYNGVATGAPTSSNTGTSAGSTSVTTPALTPTTTGALFVGGFSDASGLNPESITLTNANFTAQATNTNGSAYWPWQFADYIETSAAAQSLSWTLGDSVAWNSVIAVYAPATGIYVDGSTPNDSYTASTTSTTLTSNSFSPPANTMVVVPVEVGYGPSGSDPGVTMADSNGNTYTLGPHVFDGSWDYGAIFYFYYTNAPGSITVTATRTSSNQTAWDIAPIVLQNTSSTVGASNTAFSASNVSSFTGSITTTVTGSWVYLAATAANTPTMTPNGSTWSLFTVAANGVGETLMAGKATSPTGTPGATTLGWTTSGIATQYALAMLEILPATNSGSVSTGITFGSSVTGFSNSASVSTGVTYGSKVSGAPAGPVGIAQVAVAGDINDYGLDNIPFTMLNPFNPASATPGNALVAFIGWDVAFFGYQSTGKAPAVNVTDSAGNLWRQIGITGQQSGARTAIWIALNAQQVSWISVALTGWAYSTNYVIAEVVTPSTMHAVSIDFIQTANTNSAVNTLTVPTGTASVTDQCFAVMTTGTNTTNPSSPSSWTNIGTSGGGSAYNSTVNAYFINSQAAGSVSFAPTWTTAAPAAGIIVGLKATAAAPVQPNPNYPRVVVEAAFGANPGDWTQSVDYTYSSEGITWTDITSRCIGKEGGAVITVARGRQYELTQEETGEMTISLDNHDGVFTSTNTASPYYPNCVPGVPVRVTAWWSQTAGNPIQYPVGWGYVERWPQDWPDLPQWGFTSITTIDAYGPMSSTTMPSAVQGDIRKDYPYAYFPTSEQYSFTTNSLTNITIGGTFLFGGTKIPIDANGFYAINKAFGNNRVGAYRDGGDGIQASTGQALNLLGDSGSTFGTSGYSGRVPAVGGPVMFYSDPNIPVNGANAGVSFEFWFLTGWDSESFACTLFTAYAGPSSYYSPSDKYGAVISVGANTGPVPGLYINGTSVATAHTNPAFDVTVANPYHLVINVSPSGVNIYLNGVKTTGGTPTIPAFNKIKAVMLGSGRYSYDNSTIVNYQGYNIIAGHLAIYQHELTPTMVLNHYISGVNGFIGVTAPERYAQVLTWALLGLKRGGCIWIQNHGTNENTTISEAYSYQGSNAGDIMNQLTQTEGGRCYTTANGSVLYMPRWALYNNPVSAVFGDNGTTEIPFSQDSGFSLDNTFIYNQIDATQNRGPNTTVYYQQTNSQSQLQFFNRSGLSLQSYAMSPFDTYSAVNWAATKYNNPVQRVSQIVTSPAKSQAAVNSAFSVVLGTDLQDSITVNRRPVGGALLSVTGTIQRIEHQIGPNEWDTTYQIAPRFPDNNALVADSATNNTLGNSYLAW